MATLSMVSTSGVMVIAKPLASLTLINDCRRLVKPSVSFNGASSSSSTSLHSSFLSPPFSPSSSFSGLSLGLDLATNLVNTNRCRRLVVKAGKAALCQTKRNRSRKSLARTHGFRVRMSTTSGRAVLKRRRAKGRKVLCTKTNPTNGKRVKV